MRFQGQRWLAGDGAHTYSVGTNVGPIFGMGYLGAKEDFWLIGFDVPLGLLHPLLTGTILSADGSVLLRIVNSVLSYNPYHCQQTMSTTKDGLSYQIRDGKGNVILQADTLWSEDENKHVTAVCGRFYSRHGELVADANRGHLWIKDEVGLNLRLLGEDQLVPLTDDQKDFLDITVRTNGLINHMLTGQHVGTDDNYECLDISGAYLTQFYAHKCKLVVEDGFWTGYGVEFKPPNTIALGMPAQALAKLLEVCTPASDQSDL